MVRGSNTPEIHACKISSLSPLALLYIETNNENLCEEKNDAIVNTSTTIKKFDFFEFSEFSLNVSKSPRYQPDFCTQNNVARITQYTGWFLSLASRMCTIF